MILTDCCLPRPIAETLQVYIQLAGAGCTSLHASIPKLFDLIAERAKTAGTLIEDGQELAAFVQVTRRYFSSRDTTSLLF